MSILLLITFICVLALLSFDATSLYSSLLLSSRFSVSVLLLDVGLWCLFDCYIFCSTAASSFLYVSTMYWLLFGQSSGKWRIHFLTIMMSLVFWSICLHIAVGWWIYAILFMMFVVGVESYAILGYYCGSVHCSMLILLFFCLYQLCWIEKLLSEKILYVFIWFNSVIFYLLFYDLHYADLMFSLFV